VPGAVVGVMGAGAMGHGIAQVSAQSGARTILIDAKPGAAETARYRPSLWLKRRAALGLPIHTPS
jgi:3-hydroxybutyryl-CoA dehydrogenase